MTDHTTSTPNVDQPAGLSPADVVVLLAGCHSTEAIREGVRRVTEGIGLLGDDLKVVIGCASDAGLDSSADGGPAVVTMASSPLDRFPVITSSPHDAYRVLLAAGRKTGARAMAVVGGDEDQLTPELVRALVQPIVVEQFDVVAPYYQRQAFDGLLNAGVVYPLTRALYGRRIAGQLGVDFGFSPRVAARWGTGDQEAPVARPTWILPQAVTDDMRVCQARLDIRLPAPPDSADLSTLLSQILGSLFTDLEHRAPFWQRVQRSQAVPQFGTTTTSQPSGDAVDVRPMIESYCLAYRNLQSVWPLVLPPATLVDLKRLTVTDTDTFRLPDYLWARIVYDFALAHRLRTINRDHLLRALAPLYLAWVASYATEVQASTRPVADVRLEQLCQAFETEKPYLVRRWRWPDRFNP